MNQENYSWNKERPQRMLRELRVPIVAGLLMCAALLWVASSILNKPVAPAPKWNVKWVSIVPTWAENSQHAPATPANAQDGAKISTRP